MCPSLDALKAMVLCSPSYSYDRRSLALKTWIQEFCPFPGKGATGGCVLGGRRERRNEPIHGIVMVCNNLDAHMS